ncbi:PRC-barrel domain-containing protein [Microvirga splendida]|uniref:PRC-barrel domain-containing protein n=1 Tax=Microvirga splendida TaxID=2795727 RepID=A0ABS0Y3D2_9HYPH|nr:PRC-barrel domain-containing protein [Microvirga splendida]MBJ6126816.1 PRC-barrel domain-containing protein [Microvirga splendida]
MLSKRFVRPSLLALALGAGLAVPASAQIAQRPYLASDAAPWSNNELYRGGWSAERLMDNADVIGANGEEIGSIENIIVGQQGRILGIVAEVGGFWDIGDTHVFVPWDQVRVSANLERVAVPITEDNADDYAYAANDVLTRFGANRTQVVDDDLETGATIWKATDVIDDYAYLNDRRAYGYVNDLIFSADGNLRAVIVNVGSAWGGGYRAMPFTGYGANWNPGTSDLYLGYGQADVAELERFDYDRMRGTAMVSNRARTNASAQAVGERANVTGAVATQWTFRNIDSDGNLELTDREFSRISGNIYTGWDANRDSRLTGNEFYTGLYGVFDENRDRRVTQNEFNRGWRNWGISDQQISYGMFDANSDGILDQNEFRTGFDRIGYYDRWDADRDGDLARNEFDTGMFDVWDADSDNALAENEFGELANRSWF